MTIDFLIIGQGLAGSLLAWELINRGCNVIIVDNGKENASQIAAGLINPVTGMRFVKSTNVDDLLPTAKQCYAQLDTIFQQTFYVEKPMLRLFSSDNELTQCLHRIKEADYFNYLGAITRSDPNIKNLVTPFGFLEQFQTGFLSTQPLLTCLKEFFIAKGSYRQAEINYPDICILPTLSWKNITPKRIIFCEGHHVSKNPWFNWLPFQPVKGEILTLEHHSQLPDKIINFQHWMIPLNNQKIRVGATFDRENINSIPTEQGKINLLKTLHSISPKLRPTLLNHKANIRPCTLDKQPFIGHHPQYSQLSIFNGFGAKGSLQIPWYSQQFTESLLHNTSVPSTIQRHYATHFTA
jgi:glycine/D-amino acid oxidase-like deaminating enzyme